MSDRIAIMNEGRLEQVDDPENIYFHPTNLWVGGFIGSPPMNFFDCSLVEKDGGGALDVTEFQVPLSKESFDVIRKDGSGSELVLGVRPEDMKVSKSSVPDGIPAKVYVIEPIGDSVIVDARIGGTLIKAKADPAFQAKLDDTVYLTFDTKRMHVFDKKMGTTII
jgi:ABC-type sugar transport system ATPase subunit